MGEHGQAKEDGGQLARDHNWGGHITRRSSVVSLLALLGSADRRSVPLTLIVVFVWPMDDGRTTHRVLFCLRCQVVS